MPYAAGVMLRTLAIPLLAIPVLLSPLCVAPLAAQDLPRAVKPRVLFFTHSAGFVHPVVKRVEAGKIALAERELTEAAGDHFEIVASQDCGMLAPEQLAGFDAVLFYTTGELPIPEEHAQGLVDWVEAGGAFCGVHSATDTFYRFAPYGELIGGYFDGHPWHQQVTVNVERTDHPIVRHLGASFVTHDEIYQFKNWSRDAQTVLMSIDNASIDVSKGKRQQDDDYAVAWCKDVGAGRMFYCSLGHRHEVWANHDYQRTLLQGLRWTLDAGDRFAEAPAGARVLFDGSETSLAEHWTAQNGGEPGWDVADGVLTVNPGKGSIVTKEPLGAGILHVSFRIPEEDGEQGQGKGNSGVYIQRRYELQILDSFGREPEFNGCGSLYRQRAPEVNAGKPAGEWQEYWIRFTPARFDDGGTKTANARLTLWWNDTLVHDDVEITAKTGAGMQEGPEALPLLLQDHSNPVSFRNVWFLPL